MRGVIIVASSAASGRRLDASEGETAKLKWAMVRGYVGSAVSDSGRCHINSKKYELEERKSLC